MPAGRTVKLACSVKDLGPYKVNKRIHLYKFAIARLKTYFAKFPSTWNISYKARANKRATSNKCAGRSFWRAAARSQS